MNVNKENCKHERTAFLRGRGEGTRSRAVPASVPRSAPARPGPAPRDLALRGRGAAGRRAPGGRRLRSSPGLEVLPSRRQRGEAERARAGQGGSWDSPRAARVRRADFPSRLTVDFIALRGFREKSPCGTRAAHGDGAAERGAAPGRLRRNEMKAASRGSRLGLRPPNPAPSSSLRKEIKRTNISRFEGGQRAVSLEKRRVFFVREVKTAARNELLELPRGRTGLMGEAGTGEPAGRARGWAEGGRAALCPRKCWGKGAWGTGNASIGVGFGEKGAAASGERAVRGRAQLGAGCFF